MAHASVTAAVGFGSNLGDREAMLALGERELRATPGVLSVVMSCAVENPALTLPGTPTQPCYLNAAAAIRTTLPARGLLDRLQEIERLAGREREREERWGARVLDLDLLLYADAVIDEPGLRVPHPRMHERRFVLAPLAEVLAEGVHPLLGVSVGGLLERVGGGTMG